MANPRETKLVLASGSPRRRELLGEAGYQFVVDAADIEERHEERMGLEELTKWNAVGKARVGAGRWAESVVLAADTLVAIDGVALTKPVDLDEARGMLARLAGRTHSVVTAVAVVGGGREECFTVETFVTFLPLSAAEREVYLGLINPLDKAGGYAAQEHGEKIIAQVEGSWSNVVGLPMDETAAVLARFGVYPALCGL
jgi:septum formation protein